MTPIYPPPVFDRQRINYVLDTTSELLDRHGWIQHASGDKERGFCLTGALREAHEDPDLLVAVLRRLASRTGEPFDGSWSVVAGWNDEHGRTKDEVQDLVRRARA